jgi:hypothetical protein
MRNLICCRLMSERVDIRSLHSDTKPSTQRRGIEMIPAERPRESTIGCTAVHAATIGDRKGTRS